MEIQKQFTKHFSVTLISAWSSVWDSKTSDNFWTLFKTVSFTTLYIIISCVSVNFQRLETQVKVYPCINKVPERLYYQKVLLVSILSF